MFKFCMSGSLCDTALDPLWKAMPEANTCVEDVPDLPVNPFQFYEIEGLIVDCAFIENVNTRSILII